MSSGGRANTSGEPTTVPGTISSRQSRRLGSPTQVAIRYLARRRIAVVCFVVLIAYFATAGLSYLRLPGSYTATTEDGVQREVPLEFIGEKFERLASRRLVDEMGNPIDYAHPSLRGAFVFDETSRTWNKVEPYWEEGQYVDRERAAAFHFVLGTDIQGRSVLWRMIYSARTSLTVALGASLIALLIGTSLGAIAAYFGGILDVLITWLFTTVASIPRILLILALAYTLRGKEIEAFGLVIELSGVPMLILAMGLTTWVSLCRLIRGEVMKQKSMDYESAARALGVSRMRILVRHLMPNVMYLVIIQFSLIFPLFIHLEVILSYLGLGPTGGVSWGQMIEASLLEMMKSPRVWWQLVAATIAVFGVSIALNLFGDALRDALDPKLQQSD